MSDAGWFPAYRKMYEAGHWLAPTARDPSNRRDAWSDLLQMATYQARDTRASGKIERGELVASLRTLAKRWKWHRSRVERFMSELEVRTAIGTVRETPDGTVYRVVNYDSYAVSQTDDRDTKRDSHRDSDETAARQEQEGKKGRTKKTPLYTEGFLQLWKIHARGPKPDAFQAYRAATTFSGATHDQLSAALLHYVREKVRPDFQGVHLFRWLRDERWEEYANGIPETNGHGSHPPRRVLR